MNGPGAGGNLIPFPRDRRNGLAAAGGKAGSTARLLVHSDIPEWATSFIGRYEQVEALCALLLDENVRFLTLTGPGGIGKTRLALQVAEEVLPNFEDGTYFVPLASVTNPHLVVPTIARTLGLKESGEPIANTLETYLLDRDMLLILDNFEQVAGAAPEVAAILSAAPGVQVIVTTRKSLHLYGEHEYPVPPMALPDQVVATSLKEIAASEAIQLFVVRARQIQPGFILTKRNITAVTAICRRLDGLPLAIELAAARLRLMSPHSLLARLDKSLPLLTAGARDLPVRQQTLRKAIEWSYDLLEPVERTIFSRMSVFGGGYTLDAAEYVCTSLNLEVGHLLDRLESLVDQNLLRQGEQEDGDSRLWMLATIREYAWERLAAGGDEEATSLAHAEFFLSLAETAMTELRGPQQSTWLERLDREHDNLYGALEYLTYGRHTVDLPAQSGVASSKIEMAVRLTAALGNFWAMRGYVTEGRRWFDQVLALSNIEQPGFARPWHLTALNMAGVLAGMQGSYDQAINFTRKSLDLAGEIGDEQSIRRSSNNLGIIARRQGNYALAEEYLTRSLQLARRDADRFGMASILGNLATVVHIRGRYEEARSLSAESIALKRELSDRSGLAISLQNLAGMFMEQGDFKRAHALLNEGRALVEEVGDKAILTRNLARNGLLLCEQEDYDNAWPILNRSMELAASTGEQSAMDEALIGMGRVALHHADLSLARSYFQQALEIDVRSHALGVEMTNTLGWIAMLEVQEASDEGSTEGYRRGALLLGATEARHRAMGAPISPPNSARYTKATRLARAHLQPAVFDAAWSKGYEMSFEQLATSALDQLLPLTGSTTSAVTIVADTIGVSSTGLSERESEVLRLVASGLTNKEIGERLVLSHRTVEAHLYSIFNKLNVTTRSAAARYAMEQGLMPGTAGQT